MTPDEFLSLPAPVALRILFEALDPDTAARILAKPKPKLPLPPKYDQSIFRREGIMWASETDLEGLRYWRTKYLQSEAAGGQYAEQDKKRAASLERWIKWREAYPDVAWSGERDRVAIVAKAPSNKPTVYPRNGQRRAPQQPAQEEEIDPDTF